MPDTLRFLYLIPQSRIGEFLELVGSTLDSYVQTYKEQDLGPSFEGRKEAQFVLAICGTITS